MANLGADFGIHPGDRNVVSGNNEEVAGLRDGRVVDLQRSDIGFHEMLPAVWVLRIRAHLTARDRDDTGGSIEIARQRSSAVAVGSVGVSGPGLDDEVGRGLGCAPRGCPGRRQGGSTRGRTSTWPWVATGMRAAISRARCSSQATTEKPLRHGATKRTCHAPWWLSVRRQHLAASGSDVAGQVGGHSSASIPYTNWSTHSPRLRCACRMMPSCFMPTFSTRRRPRTLWVNTSASILCPSSEVNQ